MATITLDEAAAHLKELIEQKAGEELIIEEGGRTVARLIVEQSAQRQPRVPGSAKGMLTILVEDDEHLKDFEDYMP